MVRKRAVIVEDEILIRMYTRKQLEKLDVEVVGETGRGDEVMEILEKTRPDVVFMDIRIEGERTGIELAREFVPLLGVPVVFVSAYELSPGDVPTGPRYLGVIQKPLSARAARDIIDSVGGEPHA
jgi:DNA-binding NarL/FixJ family response regulator